MEAWWLVQATGAFCGLSSWSHLPYIRNLKLLGNISLHFKLPFLSQHPGTLFSVASGVKHVSSSGFRVQAAVFWGVGVWGDST